MFRNSCKVRIPLVLPASVYVLRQVPKVHFAATDSCSVKVAKDTAAFVQYML